MGIFAFNCWYWLGTLESDKWPFDGKDKGLTFGWYRAKVAFKSNEKVEL